MSTFLKIYHDFLEFLSFLCSILRVSLETGPSRRDRSISVPAESAAETTTFNHVTNTKDNISIHTCTHKLKKLTRSDSPLSCTLCPKNAKNKLNQLNAHPLIASSGNMKPCYSNLIINISCNNSCLSY